MGIQHKVYGHSTSPCHTSAAQLLMPPNFVAMLYNVLSMPLYMYYCFEEWSARMLTGFAVGAVISLQLGSG